MKSHRITLGFSILALIISVAALAITISTGPQSIQRVTISIDGMEVYSQENRD